MQAVDSPFVYMSFRDVYLGQAFFPFLMVFLFYLSGYYNTTYGKSELKEFLTTVFSAFISSILLYFIILINDNFQERYRNYELIAAMWCSIAVCIYIPRLIITRGIAQKIKAGQIRFNTLIIGCNSTSATMTRNLDGNKNTMGYHIIGFIPFEGEDCSMPDFGRLFRMEDLDKICSEQQVQTIIIVPQNRDKDETLHLVNKLFKYNIPIKIAPEMYDILTSNVRHANIIGEPLVNIAQSNMPEWQKSVKRTLDVLISCLAIVCLAPLFLAVAFLIKRDSSGHVFYRQERIGKSGKTFYIYKFRTMFSNAEQNGIPQLTSDSDKRITKIGKFLRKYRIDEIPQFWNVIIGDMSLVGPRPERKYFAEQIIEKAPYYALTYQIRPGITSWGMVKFGYAKNVAEMIERSKFDLIYLENMSLLIDMKIIIYTIRTVFTGKGM